MVNRVGRFVLSAVDFHEDPSRSASRCPEALASFFHMVQKASYLSGGGLHSPNTSGGLYGFETPLTFAACKAVSLGGAEDGCLTDPQKIDMKSHVNWGYA